MQSLAQVGISAPLSRSSKDMQSHKADSPFHMETMNVPLLVFALQWKCWKRFRGVKLPKVVTYAAFVPTMQGTRVEAPRQRTLDS